MKGKIQSLVLLIGMLIFFLGSASAYASPMTTLSPSTPQEKIFWVDQHGHIVRSWQGNPFEAEKIRLHERANFQAYIARHSRASAATPNISRTDNCYYNQIHTEFEAFSETVTCWQDSGTDWDAYTRDVYEIQTGSHSGWFDASYQNNPLQNYDPYFAPHETYYPAYGGGTGLWVLYTVHLD